tara:strand:- start:260 stop:964 length:705 start_codon:yes stop_codon:yes gene_type:complete
MKNDIENFVDEVVQDNITVESGDKIPNPTDPEWVDYVLDQLSDHELSQGNPTTDGLRRVTEKIFGEILVSDTEILESPKGANGRASAKHTLTIAKYNGNTVQVSACIDVLGEKLPYPFKDHLVSTACTRAEGKALRRALKIRVQTAEELSNSEDDTIDTNDDINDQQIAAIKTLCKRLDVNVKKFVKSNCKKSKTIKDVKNIQGRLMINALSSYQREGVPEEFKGYTEDVKFLS